MEEKKIGSALPGSAELPAPRLQLRWTPSTDSRWTWMCHYELVIALDKYDIRAEQEGPDGEPLPSLTELVVPIKPPSCRSGGGTPCTALNGERFCDPPYRDGAHALWDAKQLGNPPIYVIAPDGTIFRDERQEATGLNSAPAAMPKEKV